MYIMFDLSYEATNQTKQKKKKLSNTLSLSVYLVFTSFVHKSALIPSKKAENEIERENGTQIIIKLNKKRRRRSDPVSRFSNS